MHSPSSIFVGRLSHSFHDCSVFVIQIKGPTDVEGRQPYSIYIMDLSGRPGSLVVTGGPRTNLSRTLRGNCLENYTVYRVWTQKITEIGCFGVYHTELNFPNVFGGKKKSPNCKTPKSLKPPSKISKNGEMSSRKVGWGGSLESSCSVAERTRIPFRQKDGDEKYSVQEHSSKFLSQLGGPSSSFSVHAGCLYPGLQKPG